MSTGHHLPPLLSDHIFSVSSSILIDAPRDKVWSIILDFPSYKDWNTFARSMTVTNRAMLPLPDQTPEEGKHIQIVANMALGLEEPRYFDRGNAFVVISTLDSENYRVAWKTDMLPSFLLISERWQILTVDEVTGQTKYETFEVFDGVLAYLVKFFVGAKLAAGFKAAADSLKKRAEETG